MVTDEVMTKIHPKILPFLPEFQAKLELEAEVTRLENHFLRVKWVQDLNGRGPGEVVSGKPTYYLGRKNWAGEGWYVVNLYSIPTLVAVATGPDQIIERWSVKVDNVTHTLIGSETDARAKAASSAREQARFTLKHWSEVLDKLWVEGLDPIGREFIINGAAYSPGSESESGHYKSCRGFGGRKFEIQTYTGLRFTTSNLWCQGEVPAELRHVMPDNATFIEGSR